MSFTIVLQSFTTHLVKHWRVVSFYTQYVKSSSTKGTNMCDNFVEQSIVNWCLLLPNLQCYPDSILSVI